MFSLWVSERKLLAREFSHGQPSDHALGANNMNKLIYKRFTEHKTRVSWHEMLTKTI